ncbi:MAG: alpha/beta fold hydrolase, partial [Acidimicrobiia bacterium]
MRPASVLALPDGRRLAYDDVGDPAGEVVVYLHGSPDCRLARHPDDGVAAALGVRLVALDRPGFGRSSRHRGAAPAALAGDLEALADHLGLGTYRLLGWSAGGLAALAVAATTPDRLAALGLVGSVPPVEAYDDPVVLAALDPVRRSFVELAREVPPAEVGAEVGPGLVPDPLDLELARAQVVESAGPVGRAELEAGVGAG